jgi:hypothetical protein
VVPARVRPAVTPAPAPTANCNGSAFGRSIVFALFERNPKFQMGVETTPYAGGPVSSTAAGAHYQSTTSSAPTSFTAYFISQIPCLPISVAATNAAYVSNVPIPQKGSTISGEADLPFGPLVVGIGYFNSAVASTPNLSQHGQFLLLRAAMTPTGPPSGRCKLP